MSEGAQPEREFLTILDPDPVVAEEKFRRIFEHLSRWLEWKGCPDPEGAASDTVYRGIKQLDRLTATTENDLRAYLFGIAGNVALEWGRRRAREQQLDPSVWARWASGVHEEERAIKRLTLSEVRSYLDYQEWRLICQYATGDDHAQLCRDLGVTKGTLRIRIFRIRQKIRSRLRNGPGRDGEDI